MTAWTRTRWAAVAGALVVLLAGCSGGGPGPETTGGGEEDVGPLGEYMMKLGGNLDQADAEEMSRRMEELTAECMAEEGFDYNPSTQSGVSFVSGDDMPDWRSVEFAEQYGYGATTYEDMPGYVSGKEIVDPNQDYVEAMTESERTAYYEALDGPQPTPGPDGEYEWDWETAGCRGAAQHEVYGATSAAWEDEEFAGLVDEINGLYQRVADDPRLADGVAEWASCMADAGYTVSALDDAQQEIYDAVNELWSTPDGPSDAALDELREREITTAVADRTCLEQVGYRDLEREVNRDLEEEFVDTHRAELDAWVAAYGKDG